MATTAYPLNPNAWRLADQLAQRASQLNCAVHTATGARIIDAGVNELGSVAAGLLLSRICLADLAQVHLQNGLINDAHHPFISVQVDQPVPACMASQYAGWQISLDDYFAMGSGPMRAAYGKETLFDDIGHRQDTDCAVGVLETPTLPNQAVVQKIATACQVKPEKLTLIAAKTASLAGGVQIVARSVETALHKLHELKFDLARVVNAAGLAPLPPVGKDDFQALGRTNDAILYGACCTLWVTGDDASLEQVCKKLPSNTSKDYGRPFGDIFKQYDFDFYKIDPMLFSPACVTLQNIQTGNTFLGGQVNNDILRQSFFG